MPFLSYLNIHMSSEDVGVASLLLTLIALCVTLYTLFRVRAVAQAQEEATAFTQELLNIDQLEVELVRVMAKLGSDDDPESAQIGRELGVTLGRVQGVRRALGSGKDKRRRTGRRASVAVGTNFFGRDFTAETIQSAKTNIDIITGRTKLVSDFYILDVLRQACERGVTVRLIGLSDTAPDAVLADAVKTVSNPAPKDAEDYRRQIRENRVEIEQGVASWSPAAQRYFHYRLSAVVPRVSMLRCDNIVNFGFLQLYRDAQPKELKERQYIKVPISLDLGKVMLKHFDLVWADSRSVLGEDKPKTDNADVGAVAPRTIQAETPGAPEQEVPA